MGRRWRGISGTAMGPPNNEMQQTRHGENGASLLISVFDGHFSECDATE
jgi:hypothetical protein